MIRLLTIGVLTISFGFVSPAGADTITQTTKYTYDSSGRVLDVDVEPGVAQYEVKTDYTYDAYGNVKQAVVTASGISRTSSIGYDAQGRFATSATNPVGQVAAMTYDPRFGGIATKTDFDGTTASATYDKFGRVTQQTAADGVQSNTTYTACDSTCLGRGVYKATTTATSAAAPNTLVAPTKVVGYDLKGRVITVDVTSFDNTTVSRQGTWFDTYGRVQYVSRPYLVTGTAVVTTYVYDVLNRVTKATAPDGGVTTYAYDGPNSSVTNALNQTTKMKKNGRGDVMSVTDAALNTVSYTYDGLGDLVVTKDPNTNSVKMSYDTYGHKTGMTDPDMGQWSYTYDPLGELLTQTNARGQQLAYTYDNVGRKTIETNPADGLTSNWSFDPIIGKLTSETVTAASTAQIVFQRSFTYDGASRPKSITTTMNDATPGVPADPNDLPSATMQVSYVPAGSVGMGQIASVTYPADGSPTPLKIDRNYNAAGYLSTVTDDSSGVAYWQVTARDAEMHALQQYDTNGLAKTTSTYDPNTGFLKTTATTQTAGTSTALQAFTYVWDKLGNMTSRQDTVNNWQEAFTYSALNQLATTQLGTSPVTAYAHDTIGNISKVTYPDASTLTYSMGTSQSACASVTGAVATAGPHAVASVVQSNGSINNSYCYDADGNMVAGAGRTISYYAFDQPNVITQNSNSVVYLYDPEHQRYQMTDTSASQTITQYVQGIGGRAEKVQVGTSTVWNEYIMAGGQSVAMRIATTNGGTTTTQTRYLHSDHLDSVTTITDETATNQEAAGYDAYGHYRNANATPNTSVIKPNSSVTTRGYTNQEGVADVSLVNMNGRMYDPVIGTFISADPRIQSPYDGRSLNRYSYANNNPMNTVDPTGFDGRWPGAMVFGAVNSDPFSLGVPVYDLRGTVGPTDNIPTQADLKRIAVVINTIKNILLSLGQPTNLDPVVQSAAKANQPSQSPVDPIIFIGGAGDSTDSNAVKNYAKLFANSNPDLIVQYFTHDQGEDIINYIKGLDPSAPVTIVGHSWGADTGMEVVQTLPGRISVLVTIDPVGSGGTSFLRDVGKDVGLWINVNAVGGSSFDRGNLIAGGFAALYGGGAYNNNPRPYADMFLTLNNTHGDFSGMMSGVDHWIGPIRDVLTGKIRND